MVSIFMTDQPCAGRGLHLCQEPEDCLVTCFATCRDVVRLGQRPPKIVVWGLEFIGFIPLKLGKRCLGVMARRPLRSLVSLNQIGTLPTPAFNAEANGQGHGK